MEKVEEHAKDNWRKRTSTEERMLFWWHDSEYRFHFLSGREQSKNEGKEEGKEKHLKWYWRLRIMLYLPGKKISQEERQKAC